MTKFITLFIIFLFSIHLYSQNVWQTYPYAPTGSVLNFPSDDGRHNGLNVTTEWWYINLHLIGAAPAYKKYDVMLCYFSKPATMRIFNIADPVSGTFHSDVNKTPFVFSQQDGYWKLKYNIPLLISDYSNWTYYSDSKPYSYVYHAEEPVKKDELNITVVGNRAPLIVGHDGFVPIGDHGDSSFYYSYSNMKVTGTIKFAGILDTISSGIGWIDRQYGPFLVGINTQNLYEWFSLQVDNPGVTWGVPQSPSEFNIWQIFSDENSVPYKPESRLVSGMYPDDSQDTCSTFIFERTGYWYDKADKAYYSQGWRFINPLKGVNIDMTASIADQVIDVTLFKFWEGSMELKGTVNNKSVDGLGFAELVAGHDKEIKCPSVPFNLMVTTATNYYALKWSASSEGSYPIGGYRIYKSKLNDGHWQYVASTKDLFYNDYLASKDSGYYYTVSSFDDQTATSASTYAVPVWVNSITEINDVAQSDNLIRLYPNPCTDNICIELADYKNTSVEIRNLEGQLLKRDNLQIENKQIDVHNLPIGVYVIKVINDNGITTKKLIKQYGH